MIVVYCSKTGFSMKYAQWIAAELGCEAVSVRDANNLDNQDCIIYGGGITAGKINGLSKFKKHMESSNSRLIVYATGATPEEATKIINGFRNNNLTQEEQKRIPFFYFQSGINYEDMGFASKSLMKMMTKLLARNKNRNLEEEGTFQTISNSCDYSDKSKVKKLVAYVRTEVK